VKVLSALAKCLRPDLVELLTALHSAFIRFPGGGWDFVHMSHWIGQGGIL
jgi:alpha-L-arabinofuranosidase